MNIDSREFVGLLSTRAAVVLERIAFGAGTTRWYFCRDACAFEQIVSELSPGSVVTFYFDDRIRKSALTSAVRSQIEEIITRDGDAVVGVMKDEIHLRVDFPCGPRDLEEFTSEIDSSEPVFFGAFPARDSDDIDAVTFTIPDADGIVRSHPH